MKNQIFKVSLLLSFAFLFFACQKEEMEGSDIQSAEDASQSENLMNSANDEAILAMYSSGSSSGNCPTVTWASTPGTFPNTITLDFGTGCTGTYGHTKSGKILIEVTGELFSPGSIRTLTTENFFVDDVQVEGTRTVTNLGNNEAEQMHWSVEVADAQLTFADGKVVEWSAARTRTLIEGQSTTETAEDDVYSITGGSQGVNRRGQSFTSTITSPLIKPMDCRWIVEGVREVSSGDRSRTIDYGSGDCDNQAVVTGTRGNSWNIVLRR